MNFADILPEDITVLIFGKLPFEDRARGCLVNRTWNRLNRHQILGATLELHPKRVVSRSFLAWARGRTCNVEELQLLPFKGSSSELITQKWFSSGLCQLLGHMHVLQRLHVPPAQSLDASALQKLPQSLCEVSISVTFDDSCTLDSREVALVPFSFPRHMPHLQILDLQVTCVNVRSYGLVCAPSCLPPSLRSLSVSTKARGRRVGPSLMLPSPADLPNLQDLKLEATCFICQDGMTSMTSFLESLHQLHRVRLRSSAKAVNYGPMLKELPSNVVSRWEPL
ncbi:hypothetical protein COCOBI_16-1680 [Coccomyxa sp. Obi]|nr:hypothetical protein COCOBI_16-1680 [Coccomyxa sp. Obi]